MTKYKKNERLFPSKWLQGNAVDEPCINPWHLYTYLSGGQRVYMSTLIPRSVAVSLPNHINNFLKSVNKWAFDIKFIASMFLMDKNSGSVTYVFLKFPFLVFFQCGYSNVMTVQKVLVQASDI